MYCHPEEPETTTERKAMPIHSHIAHAPTDAQSEA